MALNEIRQQARRSAAERVVRLRQQRADLVKKQGWVVGGGDGRTRRTRRADC